MRPERGGEGGNLAEAVLEVEEHTGAALAGEQQVVETVGGIGGRGEVPALVEEGEGAGKTALMASLKASAPNPEVDLEEGRAGGERPTGTGGAVAAPWAIRAGRDGAAVSGEGPPLPGVVKASGRSIAPGGVAGRDRDGPTGDLPQQPFVDDAVAARRGLDGSEGDESAEEGGDGLATGADRLAEFFMGKAEAHFAARNAVEEGIGEATGDGLGDEVHEGALHAGKAARHQLGHGESEPRECCTR